MRVQKPRLEDLARFPGQDQVQRRPRAVHQHGKDGSQARSDDGAQGGSIEDRFGQGERAKNRGAAPADRLDGAGDG
jgi:hypothetical protein